MSDILKAYEPYLPLIRRFCKKHLKKGDKLNYRCYSRGGYLHLPLMSWSTRNDPGCLLLKEYLIKAISENVNSLTLEYSPSRGFTGTGNYTERLSIPVSLDIPLPQDQWFTAISITIHNYRGGLIIRSEVNVANGPVGAEQKKLEEYLNAEVHRQLGANQSAADNHHPRGVA